MSGDIEIILSSMSSCVELKEDTTSVIPIIKYAVRGIKFSKINKIAKEFVFNENSKYFPDKLSVDSYLYCKPYQNYTCKLKKTPRNKFKQDENIWHLNDEIQQSQFNIVGDTDTLLNLVYQPNYSPLYQLQTAYKNLKLDDTTKTFKEFDFKPQAYELLSYEPKLSGNLMKLVAASTKDKAKISKNEKNRNRNYGLFDEGNPNLVKEILFPSVITSRKGPKQYSTRTPEKIQLSKTLQRSQPVGIDMLN
jgi:hypothetical protein